MNPQVHDKKQFLKIKTPRFIDLGWCSENNGSPHPVDRTHRVLNQDKGHSSSHEIQ